MSTLEAPPTVRSAAPGLGYALGRRCGRHPGTWLARRLRSGGWSGKAQTFLTRHGGAAVLTGRFVGVIRASLPFAAGASGMPYRRFFFYSAAASLVWGTGNVLLGYFVGTAATRVLHSAGLIGAAVFAAVAVALFCVVWVLKRRRGRVQAASGVVASGGVPRTSERGQCASSRIPRRSSPWDAPGSAWKPAAGSPTPRTPRGDLH
ncbi:DedA family protein [Streptomyces sp. NBC_00631]|uniref:DedA family protein n=1 Tax=Streptomyces sp. NBC_00631 TaxID=2975793 RepID=UPI0030E147A2